jgi:lysophospholipase L1-like esterase
MNSSRAWLLLGALSLAGCGGGGGTGPTPPTTQPSEPTYSLTAVVFYDENGNGQLDGAEAVRLPQVDVVVGSAAGKSAAGGQAVVTGVRAGSQTVAIRTESLPSYFVPTVPMPVQVPQSAEVKLPVRLPIGDNQPNVYLGFGDSLTVGDGSRDGTGYRNRLQNLLGAHLGRAQVVAEGRSGTFSSRGAERIPGSLIRNRPAYTLVLYGTNDWNDQSCQPQPPERCYTIESLRIIVDEVKNRDSIPVLATLPPTNPALTPEGRNQWINALNEQIKLLARSEQAILADLNAAFRAKGSLPSLYADDIHPNDAGYDVIAEAFFRAVTGARSPSAAARGLPFFFSAPAGS